MTSDGISKVKELLDKIDLNSLSDKELESLRRTLSETLCKISLVSSDRKKSKNYPNLPRKNK